MSKKYKELNTGGNPECPKCRGRHVNKAGFRVSWNKGVKRMVQAHQCQDCGHQFRERKRSAY